MINYLRNLHCAYVMTYVIIAPIAVFEFAYTDYRIVGRVAEVLERKIDELEEVIGK